jgi:hypothetical protein
MMIQYNIHLSYFDTTILIYIQNKQLIVVTNSRVMSENVREYAYVIYKIIRWHDSMQTN